GAGASLAISAAARRSCVAQDQAAHILRVQRAATEDRPMRHDASHKLFEIGMILKLLDGLLELLGAALVLVVSPYQMNALARFLTQHELSEDPRDLVANHILTFMAEIAGPGRRFAAVYLFVHGVVKVVLVVEILRRRSWAYPLMLGVLILFAAYQTYRIVLAPTLGLIALTAFDLVVVVLVWREWRRFRVAA